MPGGSLLALIDDIATVLDDVMVLTQVAAKKTAGASLNDAFLALCAGAIRRYLGRLGALPSASLITSVPMATRTDRHRLGGNHVDQSAGRPSQHSHRPRMQRHMTPLNAFGSECSQRRQI